MGMEKEREEIANNAGTKVWERIRTAISIDLCNFRGEG